MSPQATSSAPFKSHSTTSRQPARSRFSPADKKTHASHERFAGGGHSVGSSIVAGPIGLGDHRSQAPSFWLGSVGRDSWQGDRRPRLRVVWPCGFAPRALCVFHAEYFHQPAASIGGPTASRISSVRSL